MSNGAGGRAEHGASGEVLAALANELHAAATQAGNDGFYRMARLLDDCSQEIDRQITVASGRERALVERARQDLAMWRALREW